MHKLEKKESEHIDQSNRELQDSLDMQEGCFIINSKAGQRMMLSVRK